MKSGKEKKISKLKKGHGWFSVILFLLFSAVVAVLIVDCVVTVGYYMLQTKMATEYESISYMSRIYDLSLQNEETGDVWNILDAEGTEYIVRDEKGALVYGDEGNTCSSEGDRTFIANVEGSVNFYLDKKNPYVWVDNGALKLNVFKLMSILDDEGMPSDNDILVINEDVAVTEASFFGGYAYSYSSDLQVRLPFWMGFDVDGGKQEFIGKGYISIMVGDLAIMGIAFTALGLLLLVVFIMFLSGMIGNIRNQARVRKVLFGDLATGGHNQTWLVYFGEKLLRSSFSARKEFAVVDLNMVKYNSYCMCHSVADGENILMQINSCIKKNVRHGELFAHASGGEFHLLLKSGGQEELMTRLRALIAELEKVESAHAFKYHLGVSMIPPFRKPSGKVGKRKWVDLEQECNNAATARKTIDGKEGSDITFFDVKLIEERKWQDQVEEHCREALQNEDFLVYYQPKYDPTTGVLKGAEALVRWRSSVPSLAEPGTLIPPGKFIPIFEQNGFITEIDHYMLRHVAADQKKWLDQGFECVPVSVNVSRAHFIEPDLAEQIRDTVDAQGTPRKYIELELTESAFFDDKNALVRTIDKLKEYGFAVSMDDFGSGYSSLNSLKDMPLDVLKLDAEFFRGENAGERGRIVVAETIKLARSLNMRTVAEGVEAKEQVDFLAGQGCDMIQGYYFEVPIPGDKFEESMKERVSSKPAAGAAVNKASEDEETSSSSPEAQGGQASPEKDPDAPAYDADSSEKEDT
ncbi:MAG: GGDEF domain-containing phosphodiesterase [Lachnospiraceae bacterium]|nr:GGDEF domain-containing phosphodiesterase [Lachnospiraceae bacterium]